MALFEREKDAADHDHRKREHEQRPTLWISQLDRHVSISRYEERHLSVHVDELQRLSVDPRPPRGVEMRSKSHTLSSANLVQLDAGAKRCASSDAASAVCRDDIARIGRRELVV